MMCILASSVSVLFPYVSPNMNELNKHTAYLLFNIYYMILKTIIINYHLSHLCEIH